MQKKSKPTQNLHSLFFTDNGINSLKSKGKERVTVGFKTENLLPILKTVKIRYSPTTNLKIFQLNYTLYGKDKKLDLGVFTKDFGCAEVVEIVSRIYKNCREKGQWIRDPRLFLNPFINLTLNDVIKKYAEAHYPRKTVTGTLSPLTARSFSRFLFGYNERVKHITFVENNKGWGEIVFKENSAIKTWGELWETYPPKIGLIKTQETSLFDHRLGSMIITDIVQGDILNYLNEHKRSYGQKVNIRDCLTSLWSFAMYHGYLGVKPGVNPTKAIVIKKDENTKKSKGSMYNDFVYDLGELQLLDKGFVKIARKRPFQSEALMLSACTGIRAETICKLQWSHITKDDEGNPIILAPRSILKGRAKVGQEDEIFDISQPVRRVLNRVKRQLRRKGFYKYTYVPYIFPSSRINKEKIMDKVNYPDYAISQDVRLSPRTLDDAMREVKKIVGLTKGAVKSLRKSYASNATKILGGEHLAKFVTHHKTEQVLGRHYNKANRANVKHMTNQVAEVYQFKKK